MMSSTPPSPNTCLTLPIILSSALAPFAIHIFALLHCLWHIIQPLSIIGDCWVGCDTKSTPSILYYLLPPARHPPANACNNITINGRLPLAPLIAIRGHKGHDNVRNAIIISPHLHNPPACPSSIILLDRGKFDAAAFNSMLVDCCLRRVLFWGWE